MNILEQIAQDTQTRITHQKTHRPLESIRAQALAMKSDSGRFESALRQEGMSFICEVKKASPSKGVITEDFDPVRIALAYQEAGATCISCLTEPKYFLGSDKYLEAIAKRVNLPVLRKDFVIESYQLLQARACGANAVLLIAACLSPEEVMSLAGQAHALGLEVLMEVHMPEELACLGPHVDMLGVNNRHLGSFHTDVRTSFDMLEALAALPSQPEPPLLVSESGLSDAQTVRQLRRAGYRGFLIGENFMKSPHPGKALSAFLQNLNGSCV